MTEFNEILSLLESERERYILEAARLERRLESIRTQVTAIDNLISGYVEEKQSYHFYQHFPQSRTQAYLESERYNQEPISVEESIENQTNSDVDLDKAELEQLDDGKQSQPSSKKVDISDIPKVKGGRQSDNLSLLSQYKGYSIKNAILILLRCQADSHFHIRAIVRSLYGDNLNHKQSETARVNVTKALSVGFKSGLWFKVLRSPGVYTLNYKKGVTAKTPKE